MEKKKTKFWRVYWICAALGAVVAVIFLVCFNGFIGSYEASQPYTAVEGYLESFDRGAFAEMAEEAVGELEMTYEKHADYVALLCDAFDEEQLSYRKYLQETTSDKPVFSILSGDVEVLRLSLRRAEDGAYGFARWAAESAMIPLDGVTSGAREYTVYAPVGSTVSVNGFTPEISEEGIKYPISGELEKTALPDCNKYELGTLYSEPELVCTLGEKQCVSIERGKSLYFFAEGSAPQSYTVSAPSGATVLVNGIELSEKYITEKGKPYEYSSIEKGIEGLPTYDVYSTGELFASPTVTASLEGITLSAKAEGASCSFAYPEILTYSISISVPKGSTVKIGETDLRELVAPEEKAVWGDLVAKEGILPRVEIYKLTGLYTSSHNVEASLDGTALKIQSVKDGNLTEYSADHTTMVNEAVSSFATDFTRAYFHYTSSGYDGLDENLQAVLAYVSQGTEIYSKIKNSRNGYYYVTPVSSSEYRTLQVAEMMLLEDGTVAVSLDFEILQRISYVEREYKGTISLHISGTGENMKILNMIIDNE